MACLLVLPAFEPPAPKAPALEPWDEALVVGLGRGPYDGGAGDVDIERLCLSD